MKNLYLVSKDLLLYTYILNPSTPSIFIWDASFFYSSVYINVS